jgi:hypothetical protein
MYQKIPPTRRRNQFGPHYGFGMEANRSLMVAVIEQAGVPALRIAFALAVIIFLFGGVLIFRRRHQLFDRDPNVENDVPVVRHNRLEQILFILGRADAGSAQHLVPSVARMT